eukprot:TRINITY_DN2682_c0_g1_i1.p1 TRINITY_DN2682_c0_g1~~TRINITY_DN2682_c0_g1_i1.p1  ORF type:complete len:595 (-),score=59.60 TRINITY_DN2682_c0_g1_i1:142-1926(-)
MINSINSENEPLLFGTKEVPWIVRKDGYGPTFSRFSVLGVTSYYLLSTLFCDEMLSAAAPFIKDAVEGLDSSSVGILYSATFVPSLIFVLAGGFLHKIVGVRVMSLISTFSMLLGIIVFALSANFVGMLVGRILFGIGLGPIEVINDIVAMRWFDAYGATTPSLQFAFSVIAAVGMGGCIIGFNLVPVLLDFFDPAGRKDLYSLQLALLVLCVVPLIAFFLNIYYNILDWYATPYLGLDSKDDEHGGNVFAAVKELPLTYWLLFYITAASSSMIHVIMLYSVDYLTEKWEFSNIEAGQISSGVYVTGIFISLGSGWVIAKYGKMVTLLFMGLLLFGTGCVLLGALDSINPIYAFILVGVGLGSLETTVWTAVASVIPDACIGPAFSFLSAIGAIILLVVPYGAGWVHDNYGSYDYVAYGCAAGAYSGLVAVLALYFLAPELQNVTDDVYTQFFVVRVVKHSKKRAALPRRHSIIGPDVKDIIENTEEGEIDHEKLFKRRHPVFIDDNKESYLEPGDRSSSLPGDFFSSAVKHSLSVAIAEGVDVNQVPKPQDPFDAHLWEWAVEAPEGDQTTTEEKTEKQEDDIIQELDSDKDM